MLPKHLSKLNRTTGQALLIVLLSMAVILTVVLSVSSRSISDISIGSYEEDALRAFSAAEAGIEKALLSGEEFVDEKVNPADESVTFTSEISTSTPSTQVLYPAEIVAGETATFWMVPHNEAGELDCSGGSCYSGTGPIRVCWGIGPEPPMATRPAIEVSTYYDDSVGPKYLSGDFSNVKVHRLGFDRYASETSSTHRNGFSTAVQFENENCLYEGKQLLYRTNPGGATSIIPNSCGGKPGCTIMIKVRMFYNNLPQPVALFAPGGVSLPPQGLKIESTGSAGNSTRKINVFQSFAEPPNIFDSAVYSETNFVK